MDGQNAKTRSSGLAGTRRNMACVTCQRQKVRCTMDDDRPPCRRCKKRRVVCTFNKSSSAPPEDIDFRAAVVHDLKTLHAAVNDLQVERSHVPLSPLRSVLDSSNVTERQKVATVPETNEMDTEILDENTGQIEDAESISQAPIASLYQITRLRSLRSKRLATNVTSPPIPKPRDLISRGFLDLADADRLVRAYLDKPDHYLYGIASKFEDLESIRNASPLLLVAICTVSALQDPSGRTLYRVCHAELRRLISDFVFTIHVTLEDLRALCITCFWLSDISWPISGLAIRRAVEFELQKSYHSVIKANASSLALTPEAQAQNQAGAIERVRLWYLFNICDQHLSILYGRPSTIREQESLRDCETYLMAVQGAQTDMRIVSQVSLLLILNKASDLFGPDVDARIPVIFKSQLDYFNDQLDKWVATWLSRYKPHPHIGEFPSKAVTMHFYFAKLFVCSHVFRGLTFDAIVDPLPTPFKDTAMVAVESAKSIVDLVIRDDDIKSAFIGMPHYYHTMIAFACSFLLKIATKYRQHVAVEVKAIFEMISCVVTVCKNSQCTPYHLVPRIGEGLQVLLSNCMNSVARHESGRGQNRPQQQFMQQVSPATQDTMQDHDLGTTQNLGNVWDTAREAAMLYPNDRLAGLYEYPDPLGGGVEMFQGINSSLLGLDSSDSMWDTSMTSFDAEHMGLRLL